jgi:hypothetical protein
VLDVRRFKIRKKKSTDSPCMSPSNSRHTAASMESAIQEAPAQIEEKGDMVTLSTLRERRLTSSFLDEQSEEFKSLSKIKKKTSKNDAQKRANEYAQLRIADLKQILAQDILNLKNLGGSFPFLNHDEEVLALRKSIDICTLELFNENEIELCPSCYASFDDKRPYFGTKTKICLSHIYSRHFLVQIGNVAVLADERGNRKLQSSTTNMRCPMQCTDCDNLQGRWEGLVCNDLHYADLKDSNLALDSFSFSNSRNWFRFFIPNLFRATFSSLSYSEPSTIFSSIFDLLRRYLYRHLYLVTSNPAPPLSTTEDNFFLYVFITTPLTCALALRNVSLDLVDQLVDQVSYNGSIDVNEGSVKVSTVGCIVGPFIVCISCEAISSFQNYRLVDEDVQLIPPLVDPREQTVLSYIHEVFVKAHQSQVQFVNSLPESMRQQIQIYSEPEPVHDSLQYFTCICKHILESIKRRNVELDFGDDVLNQSVENILNENTKRNDDAMMNKTLTVDKQNIFAENITEMIREIKEQYENLEPVIKILNYFLQHRNK